MTDEQKDKRIAELEEVLAAAVQYMTPLGDGPLLYALRTRNDEKALEAAAQAIIDSPSVLWTKTDYQTKTAREFVRLAITAYLSAREEAGFVEVPREPTEAQRAAGDGAIDQYESRHLILAEDREAMAVAAYRAMIAKAR